MRRSIIAGGVVVAIGAAATGGFILANAGAEEASATTDPDPAASSLETAVVTRGDLVREEELEGTTGYGEAKPLVLAPEGTLTSLPEAGAVIESGDVVAEINGVPVLAAKGSVPMWRDLGNGVDDGVDVQQVEQMLADLGYAATYDVTVDQEWTSATTRALRDFQEDRGLEKDGTIAKGDLVFIEEAVRVSAVAGVPGQATAVAGIEVTGTDPVVEIDVDADDSDLVAVGDEVAVELSNGDVVPGTVTDIGAATTAENGSTTMPAEVTIDAGVIGALPTGSSVEIHVPIVSAESVLSVPVEALLAVAEGGYAVEVTDGAATRLVGVDTGAFADGRVEITGTTAEINEGMEVVVP